MLRFWLFLIFVFQALSVFATEPINNGQNFCGALVAVISEQKKHSDSTFTPEKVKALLPAKNPGPMPNGQSFNTLVEYVKELQKNDSSEESNPSKITSCMEEYSRLFRSQSPDFLTVDLKEENNKQDDTAHDEVQSTVVTKIFNTSQDLLTEVHSEAPAVHDAPIVDDCE